MNPPRPSRPLTSAERAVKAFERYCKTGATAGLPKTVDVSARGIPNGVAGGFPRNELLVTLDTYRARIVGVQLRESGSDFDLVYLRHNSDGSLDESSVLSGPAPAPYTLIETRGGCAKVGGCAISFGGTTITVRGIGYKDILSPKPDPSATSILFFYGATF